MSSTSGTTRRAEDWAGEQGIKWNTYIDEFEGMIGPVGEAVVEFADVRPGERVLDVGCGGGQSSLAVASIVGESGHVTGIDLSPVLVDTARARAEARGFGNVDFLNADASTARLDGVFDHLFSRFGLMFFDDSIAAMTNLRGLCRSGGRLSFCCWGPLPSNPWVRELMRVPAEFVELPETDPRAPGPFAFADTGYVTEILTAAGFGDVEFEAWNGPMLLGGPGSTAETAARFALDATFIGETLRDEPARVKHDAYARLVEVLEAYQGPDGVSMQGSAWLVRAKASGEARRRNVARRALGGPPMTG